MKALTMTLAAVLLAACGGGSAGPAGPRGPAGEPGPQGSAGGSGSSLLWVDAAGTAIGEDLIFVDSRKLLWTLDSNFATTTNGAAHWALYYASTDCSGTALALALPPRAPFMVIGETQWRVRPDLMPAASTLVKSFRTVAGGTCVPDPGSQYATVPADASTVPSPAVSVPSIPFVPPFHQELR